jgi:hypothetical protein
MQSLERGDFLGDRRRREHSLVPARAEDNSLVIEFAELVDALADAVQPSESSGTS